MLAKHFNVIIQSEENTIAFLKEKGLIETDNHPCVHCGSLTKYYIRKELGKERTVIRCTKKGCQRTQSVRKGNTFFTYKDKNGRCNSGLSLSNILELAYYWCLEIPQNTIIKLTGRGSHTVHDWMNLCRDIPVAAFEKRRKMGGTNTIVQVDESLMRGKRKYNRGRLLGADIATENVDVNEVSDEEEPDFSNRNYGQKLTGPWVFGMCQKDENGVIEARYIVVEKRDRPTLHGIIQNEIEIGTEIHSDEWLAYKTLETKGYIHKTVNHSQFFVDPINGAHTQRIESLWGGLKLRIVKKMHGTSPSLLPSYLAEQWWRLRNSNDDIFECFLRDVKLYCT